VAGVLLTACGGGAGGGNGQSQAAPSTGASNASITWDAVADPNLSGYRIYYGTASGTYLQPLGQGLNVESNVITHTVTGLSGGKRYYFAATAYDAAGNESGYSNEVFEDVP